MDYNNILLTIATIIAICYCCMIFYKLYDYRISSATYLKGLMLTYQCNKYNSEYKSYITSNKTFLRNIIKNCTKEAKSGCTHYECKIFILSDDMKYFVKYFSDKGYLVNYAPIDLDKSQGNSYSVDIKWN